MKARFLTALATFTSTCLLILSAFADNVPITDPPPGDPPKDPEEEGCKECSCSEKTDPSLGCISFRQPFGRTPLLEGTPAGAILIYENDPQMRKTFIPSQYPPIIGSILGTPSVIRYDHPMERKIVSCDYTNSEVTVQDSTGTLITYKEGKPYLKSSGLNLQCSFGSDGNVVELLEDQTQVIYGSDNAVYKLITPKGVEVFPSDLGIEVIKDLNGMRQVWSKADGLMDITIPASQEMLISWYAPSSVSGLRDASGLFLFTGAPVKTFLFKETQTAQAIPVPSVDNGGGSAPADRFYTFRIYHGLTLEERRGEEFLFSYDWSYDWYARDWTFTRGTGAEKIIEAQQRTDKDGITTVIRVKKDAAGHVLSRDRKVYKHDDKGPKLISQSIGGASGEMQTVKSATRIDSGLNTGRRDSLTNRHGGKETYLYDSQGRKISITEELPNNITQVTTNSYPAGYPTFVAVNFVDRRPERTVVLQNNVPVSDTTYVYSETFQSVTRRDPKTSNSLTTCTYFYPKNAEVPLERGRVRFSVKPDGTATYYTYAMGENDSWIQTVTQGYWNPAFLLPGPSYMPPADVAQLFSVLPGKSTRIVHTHDFRGDVVRTDSYVHTGSEFTLAGWETYTYNIMHKLLGTTRHDGTSELSNWICTGPVWQRNADGTTVTNTFDSAKRIKTSTHYTPFGNVTKTYTYDAESRIVSQTTATNGVTVGCGIGCGATYSEFDAQGRTILSVDAQGRTNRIAYSADNLVVTRTDPAGAIVVENYGTDGSLLSRTGNVMRAEYYTKGVDVVTGTLWEKTTYGSPAGADYNKSYYNALGQLVLQERPGFGGATLKTVYCYNDKGQLETQSQIVLGGTGTYDLPVMTYVYNQLGASIATTQAVANVYRVQSSENAFAVDNGIVQQTSVSVQSCSDASIPATTNVSIQRLYPMKNGMLAESRQRDVRGNETVQKVVQDPATYIQTTTVSNATSVLPAISISLAGLTLSQTDQHGCTTTYGYDALMRQLSAETRSGPNNERLTGNYTHFNVIGQVDYTEDAFGSRTVYGYDLVGRKVAQTFLSAIDSLSNSTYTAYDPAGKTLATWGATYPVAYDYDQAGRMTAMYTYRGTNAIASYSDIVALKTEMDRTQWLYDQATGLLTNKLYSDGKGPAYSYTALGQLATRKWARLSSTGQQLLTQYKYDNFGSLTNTVYSDGTPSVTFTLNALGQMKTITDASGTRTIDYAADGQMLAEHLAFNTSLFILHEKSDALGRNVGYALSNEVALITGTMQSFDQYGRLNQVAAVGITGAFTYDYLEGSHLQKTLAMPNAVTRTFGYEPNRDLLTSIIHSNAASRLVQRDFTFDGLARLQTRTVFRANETPVQPDAFGYNHRSELTNAVIGANAFAYNFDPIGNRLSATELGTNTAYVTSALNQYTSINPINPVNPVENFTPEFDLDGNQTLIKTTTGIWHVTYNDENRPVLFSNATTVVEMGYDYMGRRFEYKETFNNTLTRHERYLYRGYLQIAALDPITQSSNNAIRHCIIWDPTEPTATRPLALQVGTAAYYYSFDQLKNVTELFDSTSAIAATYEYSPFGQITSALSFGSTMFDVRYNPLTFSSEVHDSTLGLQYYNYRHLNVLDGWWVNRDAILDISFVRTQIRMSLLPVLSQAEITLENEKVFVKNDPVSNGDTLGLLKCTTIVGKPDRLSLLLDAGVGKLTLGFSYSSTIKKCELCCKDGSVGQTTEITGTFRGDMSGDWDVLVGGYPVTLGFSGYIAGQTVEKMNTCTGKREKFGCKVIGANVHGSVCFPPNKKAPIRVCVKCSIAIEGKLCDGSPEIWRPKGGCTLEWCTFDQCVGVQIF